MRTSRFELQKHASHLRRALLRQISDRCQRQSHAAASRGEGHYVGVCSAAAVCEFGDCRSDRSRKQLRSCRKVVDKLDVLGGPMNKKRGQDHVMILRPIFNAAPAAIQHLRRSSVEDIDDDCHVPSCYLQVIATLDRFPYNEVSPRDVLIFIRV